MNKFLIFMIKIHICIFAIILFYKYIKASLYAIAGKLAIYFRLINVYSYEVAKGVIELPLIVFTHLLFAFLTIKISGISWSQLGLNYSAWQLCAGFLLGIGIMGTASMLGRLYIEALRYFLPNRFPMELKNWLAMARSGWIRHHFHTIEVLPSLAGLMVTLGQVCAEEIIFRGVLINIFIPYGKLIALLISTALFILMQAFQMPNRISAIFPMIGALVMGLVGGVLYIESHCLIPLIIAHITFFAMAVL